MRVTSVNPDKSADSINLDKSPVALATPRSAVHELGVFLLFPDGEKACIKNS